MSATTPLPWITSDDPAAKPQPIYRGIIAYMGQDVNGQHHMVWTINNEYSPAECMQANAELIVKAVQAYSTRTALINAARAAAVALRDIGTVTPSGKFCPQLIRIAQSLESALKEAHNDTA